MMRKTLAIFFLILFSFSSTEAYQLLKLPKLISHFAMHKENGSSASILDFLQEHYVGQHEDDGDSDSDQQLPFKTFNPQAFQHIFLPAAFDFASSPNLSPVPKWTGYLDKNLPDNNTDIFHPPAVV